MEHKISAPSYFQRVQQIQPYIEMKRKLKQRRCRGRGKERKNAITKYARTVIASLNTHSKLCSRFFIRLASSLSISPFYVCSLVRVLWYARMHWYDGRKFFVAIIKLVKVMNKLEKLMLYRRKVRNCTHVNVSCCKRNESWFAIRIAHKLNNANQSLTLTRKWQMANGKRQKTTYPN